MLDDLIQQHDGRNVLRGVMQERERAERIIRERSLRFEGAVAELLVELADEIGYSDEMMNFGEEAGRIAELALEKARYDLVLGDGFRWMKARAEQSIHALVTDPPYGLKEYIPSEVAKLRRGRGGVWRFPPALGGHMRSPLPRFTVLSRDELVALERFFAEFASDAMRVLVPGAHVFIAGNPLLTHLVYGPMIAAGFEKRGEIIRLVQTLRGGDRPKNAHEEFAGVSVMPRSAWEPWGLFRKPCEGRVQDNLRNWGTGGLRRVSTERPFTDVIPSGPTRPEERALSPHPSLKPQAFMRQLVRAALPLGRGVVLDPFMGGGATIAAASAVGYESIGVELDPDFFAVAEAGIPRLSAKELRNE